ncbi:MAG: MBL fold metallo-hydrolase, partial [Solirubrobacterales bacterium]
MKHLARDLYQLALTPREAVNAYLVGDVLVDCGYPMSWKRLHSELGGRKPAAHALTHAHADHAGCAGRLRAEDGREVWVGENDRELLESGQPEPGEVPLGRGLLRRYMAFDGLQPDRLLKAGDELDAGFVVIDTPGHSPGHVSFWREEDRGIG